MMAHHKQKRPAIAGPGISENIHLQQANNKYFNMILSNPACASFCCELLELFEDLLNRYCPGSIPDR